MINVTRLTRKFFSKEKHVAATSVSVYVLRTSLSSASAGFKHKGQNIDLNVVRLCFQVFLPDAEGKITRIVTPVVSQAIHDKSK